ncbi:hypothetical protein B0H10DRAFT_2217173 [Mycena sp. CBHHK59/15]|nr:hypothetical protein B0H10DRAFT_2217173 [Mycena sp. CBHHK59/15]
MPWIFCEVYNWSRASGDVWPDTLWQFFATVHIRDCSVSHPKDITLLNNMFSVLTMMCTLTKVDLRLAAPIPPALLAALSLVPHLKRLEIHQARLDGPSVPRVLPFTSL